jgi:hypothetical protein
MKNSRGRQNKGIAIILTLFLLVFLVIFAEITWSYYISNSLLQKHFISNLQTMYDLETAKTACLWEENHAVPPMSWNTVTNTFCRLQGATISAQDHFYRLADFNFQANVTYSGGINIYIHAFKGSEANPQNSQYLEFVYYPNAPLYQYVMFKNSSVSLPLSGYNTLISCGGGKIHINGDITFNGNYVRLDQITQLSSSGTVKYAQSNLYPAPHFIDNLDGVADGMAPAPSLGANHYYTTNDTPVTPGPFKYWAQQNVCVSGVCTPYYYPAWKSYGDWVGGSWGNNVPNIWRGEEMFFTGNQYYETSYPNAGVYLKRDGTYQGSQPPIDEQATVVRFYPSDLSGSSLTMAERTGGKDYYNSNVYFRPYKDSEDNLNDSWFEIPGVLPQEYTWGKYSSANATERSVTFYTTQECASGNAGCNYSAKPDEPAPYTTGWRYLKQLAGNTCTNDSCYNNPNSQYVKAQNYTYNGRPYFDNISPTNYDKNNEFFSNYIYGEDAKDPASEYRQIRSFDTSKQADGFMQLSTLLSQKNMGGVISPGSERKEVYLGDLGEDVGENYSKSLFDDNEKDSIYKLRAQEQGLYIDSDNADTVIDNLNASGEVVAKKVSFYDWQTNREITLIDIDIEKMREQNKAPANGIVYTKLPVRFSNAENLPGQNSGDGKKAVFTVISEGSVYLKGDYNYDPDASPEVNEANWKLSNIATKKVVYTLSDNFKDSGPIDFAVYRDYPYVYVKANVSSGKVVFLPKEGDPSSNNGKWLRGDEGYISSTVRNWILNTVATKQSEYAQGMNPPNRVADFSDGGTDNDKTDYHYVSLFITSYSINDSLENWYYIDSNNTERRAQKYIAGTMLDLYANDPEHPEYAHYKAALSPEEGTWDYRGRQAPNSSSYIQSNGARVGGASPSRYLDYDSRLASAVPLQSSYTATLGVTGDSVWRLITQEYFNRHIQ